MITWLSNNSTALVAIAGLVISIVQEIRHRQKVTPTLTELGQQVGALLDKNAGISQLPKDGAK